MIFTVAEMQSDHDAIQNLVYFNTTDYNCMFDQAVMKSTYVTIKGYIFNCQSNSNIIRGSVALNRIQRNQLQFVINDNIAITANRNFI